MKIVHTKCEWHCVLVVHTTQRGAPLTGSILQEGVLVLRKSLMKEIPTSHLVQFV